MTRERRYETTIRWPGAAEGGHGHLRPPGPAPGLCFSQSREGPISFDAVVRRWSCRQDPVELLVASLSAGHMFRYLALCSRAGVLVTSYVDRAVGVAQCAEDGRGRCAKVTLHPHVVIGRGQPDVARRLHDRARKNSRIANSVNFPVELEPRVTRATGAGRVRSGLAELTHLPWGFFPRG